jgi:hypothetical protein
MALPTAATVAKRAGISDNDPSAPIALAIALSWARDELGRAVDDALSDLDATGNEAVLGAAADFLKLPAAQSALVVDNDAPSALPFDIGRRWAPLLNRRNKHLWAVR